MVVADGSRLLSVARRFETLEGRERVLRLRRHPAAGLFLVAALAPLLGAGPVMTCGEMAAGHRDASRAPASQDAESDSGSHAPCAAAGEAGQGHVPLPAGPFAESPDEAPSAPSAPCCSLGLTCSSAGIATRSAEAETGPVLLAVQSADVPHKLHSSDSTLQKRPPRA